MVLFFFKGLALVKIGFKVNKIKVYKGLSKGLGLQRFSELFTKVGV